MKLLTLFCVPIRLLHDFIKLTPNISRSQASSMYSRQRRFIGHAVESAQVCGDSGNWSVRPSESTWTIRSEHDHADAWTCHDDLSDQSQYQTRNIAPSSFSESRVPAHSSEKHDIPEHLFPQEKEIALPGSHAEVVLIKLNVSLHC